MNKKAQELEIRNIMQGMEELANFTSFRTADSTFRILSVETVEQDNLHNNLASSTADILDLQKHVEKKKSAQQQMLRKSLSFVQN